MADVTDVDDVSTIERKTDVVDVVDAEPVLIFYIGREGIIGNLIGRVITKMTICLEHSSVLILFVAKCKCVCNDLSITCVQ